MENKYCVYKHTNQINDKVYIGYSGNIEDRWSRQGNRYERCSYFYQAIQKYGWDNFSHEILENNLTLEEALKREIYWISFYQSNQKEYGYNLTSGGEGPLKISEETKQKMSQSRQKYLEENQIKKPVRNVETGIIYKSCSNAEKETGILKSQIFACCSHYPSSFTAKGFHWVFIEEMPEWNEELKKIKIQEIESLRGGTQEDKERAYTARVAAKGKKVLCIELNRTFLSTREAARKLNLDYSRIGKVCRGQAKTAGGYHWKYIEEEKNDIN